jgi:hypothetical protein
VLGEVGQPRVRFFLWRGLRPRQPDPEGWCNLLHILIAPSSRLLYTSCALFVGAAAASDNWPPPKSNVPSAFGALEFVWFS